MSLNPNERLLIGQSPAEAARLAADALSAALAGPRETWSVALAGGSTPKLLYEILAGPVYRERVDWQAVDWFWSDERAVPLTHAESNFNMARHALLDPLGLPAAGPRVHPMPAYETELCAAAERYEQIIRSIVPGEVPGTPVFDLILLGVGPDGHTASLFPATEGLHETKRLVVANFAPTQNAWRMTMTYPLLMAAGEILFFVTGAGKAEIMARVLSPAGRDLPAARLRGAAGRVTWVLDAEAARLVNATGGA